MFFNTKEGSNVLCVIIVLTIAVMRILDNVAGLNPTGVVLAASIAVQDAPIIVDAGSIAAVYPVLRPVLLRVPPVLLRAHRPVISAGLVTALALSLACPVLLVVVAMIAAAKQYFLA